MIYCMNNSKYRVFYNIQEKEMKNRNYIFGLLIILITITLIGCGSGTTEVTGDDRLVTSAGYAWVNDVVEVGPDAKGGLIFNSNGTFQVVDNFSGIAGVWLVSTTGNWTTIGNNTLTLTAGEITGLPVTYTISGNMLTVVPDPKEGPQIFTRTAVSITSYNNNSGTLEGTWTGVWTKDSITIITSIVISNTGWVQSTPTNPNYDTGIFHRVDNTAALFSNSLSFMVGRGSTTGLDTLSVSLNESALLSNTTQTLYRNNFIGNWSGNNNFPGVGEVEVIAVSTPFRWSVSIPAMSLNETGPYIIGSSTTITLYNDNDQEIGTATLSNGNNTLTIVITEVGGAIQQGTTFSVNRN